VEDPYARWAQVYDLFYPDRGDEARFWHGLLGGSDRQVLDLMCGTAEVSLALARLGHPVVGIDRSAAMLAVGKERLEAAADYPARNLSLVQGDACAIPVPHGRFEFVLVGGNGSFNHLDRDQAVVALAEMIRVLRPGGGLGLELINPFLLSQIDARRVLKPLRPVPPDTWLEMHVANRYDAAAGQFQIQQTVRYELAGDRGEWAESFILHAWAPDQLRAFLEAAGLGDICFYGDYDLRPFDRWSSDLLVVAGREEPGPPALT
jgi:SAM-dependent methyltransferase